MIERIKLLDGYGLYAVSSLGYVINLGTGKILAPRTTTNQVAMNVHGKQEYSQMRKIIAEQFEVPTGKFGTVWHLDNNPYNNAEENLWQVDKRSHLDKGYRIMQRMLEHGDSIEEIGKVSGLGEEFVNQVVLREGHTKVKPFLYRPRERWTEERLILCEENLVAGESFEIRIELVEDYIQKNELNQQTIVSLDVLRK